MGYIQVVAVDKSEEKKMKGCVEEESKITEQNSNSKSTTTTGSTATNNKNCKGPSANNSKENSKASDVPKPDYIHVRARRGQATDSHSLAERVRNIYHVFCCFVLSISNLFSCSDGGRKF